MTNLVGLPELPFLPLYVNVDKVTRNEFRIWLMLRLALNSSFCDSIHI